MLEHHHTHGYQPTPELSTAYSLPLLHKPQICLYTLPYCTSIAPFITPPFSPLSIIPPTLHYSSQSQSQTPNISPQKYKNPPQNTLNNHPTHLKHEMLIPLLHQHRTRIHIKREKKKGVSESQNIHPTPRTSKTVGYSFHAHSLGFPILARVSGKNKHLRLSL